MESLRATDPARIGGYRLLGRLGEGGMGEVFLGESPDRRWVAVKLLRARYAGDATFRQWFAREVAAAKMVGGAHTAPVVDADPGANPPWLATAYIPGPSLAAAVKRNGPLDPGAVCRLGAALADGLAAIHACRLVHRDLKPANIVLGEDGPRIIDFGLAQAHGVDGLTSAGGGVIGTPSFMSPEQVAGARVDTRGDVFSLGSVLAYAARGLGPFDADTLALIVARIKGGPPTLDGIGGQLRDVIESCLAKDPAARPSLGAVAAGLAAAGRAPSPRFAAQPEPEPAPSWVLPLQPPGSRPTRPNRRPGAVSGAFSAVTGAVSGAMAALRPGQDD